MMGYTEFGKYLTKYRARHNILLGEMAQKLSMKITRLSNIQTGARITDDEFHRLTKKYPAIGKQMLILYHAIGLDKYDDNREYDGKYYIYRNYFAALSTSKDYHVLKKLEKLGYMKFMSNIMSRTDDMHHFGVTEKGLELIRDITGLRIVEEE